MKSLPIIYYGERILLTLWVGGLWAIGYLAVPILFATLDDRMLAGMLAGKMFTALSLIGLGVGTALLVRELLYTPRPLMRWHVRLLMLMLLIVGFGEFFLQPLMESLKAEGLVPGSEAAAQFGILHGVASILYLINSLVGLVVLAIYINPGISFRKGAE